MKNYISLTLMALMVFSVLFPEHAWAISEIDGKLGDFRDWLVDSIAETIAVTVFVLWGLNAYFGWISGGTNWKAGVGILVITLIIFNAENLVAMFK